jgi:hypothetical protein
VSLQGILKLPFTLTLTSTGVTTSDSVADVESDIVDYEIPKGMAVAFRAGDTLYLVVADATNTQITSGTARLYIADANKVAKIQVGEAPLSVLDAGGTPEDLTKQYKLKQGFSRESAQHLLISVESATAVDISQTVNDLQLTGLQIVQV